MRLSAAGLLSSAALLLTGCFISSPHEAIPAEIARFPLPLPAGETALFAACERDDHDPTDWTDCAPITLTRAADHYVVTSPNDPPMALRFAEWHAETNPDAHDYIFQVGAENPDEEDGYFFGVARYTHDKLFLALPDADFIPPETCLQIGALDPNDEKACGKAINTAEDVRAVMNSLDGSQQYTLMLIASAPAIP